MRKATIILNVVGIVLILGAAFAYANRGAISEWIEDRQKTDLPAAVSVDDLPRNVNASETNANASLAALPSSFDLAVSFTVQAPHANWELPYQEACEEAASLMVHFFYSKQKFASADHADSEILKIVDFQTREYGDYKDTTAEQTAQFIRDLWGYETVRVVKNPTIDGIKREVYAGHPVIVPAAGQQLGNPNFRQPGPLYHMLVVRGWTKNGQFITNDPGTRRGERYVYDPDVLMSAMHDWNGGDVVNGQKVVIIVEPNQ